MENSDEQYVYDIKYITKKYFSILAIFYDQKLEYTKECDFCKLEDSFIITNLNINTNGTSWPPVILNRYMRMGKKCFNENTKDNKYYFIKKHLNKITSYDITQIVISYL